MSFRFHLTALVLWGVAVTAQAAVPPAVLFKSPFCSCCGEYVNYLQNKGFKVDVRLTEDMQLIRRIYKVGELNSCHTTVIQGYTVEGHVPVASIQKLLKSRPKITGISLPGMPPTSPGMGPAKAGSLKIVTLEPSSSRVFDIQ